MATPDDFRTAGLYDPEVDADTGRLELLQWLDGFGVTVEELVRAAEEGELVAVASDRRLVPDELLTREAAMRLVSTPGDSLDEDVAALGFVRVTGSPQGEVGLTATEVAALAEFHELSHMFSPAEATGLLRVIGSSIGRIAEAAVSVFLSDVESESIATGESEFVHAKKVYDAVGLLDGFAARLDPILRRHVLQAIERTQQTLISESERFQYRYAIGFVDLVGFTAISSEMSPRELGVFLREFEGRAYDVATSHGARVVKLIGDEVMFIASDASAACRTGSDLMRSLGGSHGIVVPRGGVAYGDVLVRGGDYYGPIVNLASRLVDEAVPEELLVTDELAAAANGCVFEPAGRRMVKGFADPISVQSLQT